MTARIVSVEDGLVTVRVAGKLAYADLRAVQSATAEVIGATGTIRALVLAEDFEGWEKGGDWGDLSFQYEFDARIEKMAIVGKQRWEDLVLVFASKGLRGFPVEHFLPEDIPGARLWLPETRQPAKDTLMLKIKA